MMVSKFIYIFERKQYEPYRVKVISNGGATTQIYEKAGTPYIASTFGLAEMRTITDTGTTNHKHYALSLDQGSMQWLGMETAGTLDGLEQSRYEFDPGRLLYTAACASPDGGTTWFTNQFSYTGYAENLAWHRDPLGNESVYRYAGNDIDLVESIDPRGIISSNQYDSYGNPTLALEDTAGFNRQASNEYNSAGQVIRSIDPLSRISRNFYSTGLGPIGVGPS